jgi:hypothetical protein
VVKGKIWENEASNYRDKKLKEFIKTNKQNDKKTLRNIQNRGKQANNFKYANTGLFLVAIGILIVSNQ